MNKTWTAFLTTTLLLATASAVAEEIIVVDSVVPDRAAAAAGVQVGDRLLRLAGREIENRAVLNEILAEQAAGDTVGLTVLREDEPVDLKLTFGKRQDGGPSIGVSLAISMYTSDPGAAGHGHPHGAEPGSGEGATSCLEWIEGTYRIEMLMREWELDITESHQEMQTCVGPDRRKAASGPEVKYCDNIFKIHCAGLDLLTEVGEEQVQRCKKQLESSLGLTLSDHKGWKTCAQHEIFDRYTKDGATIEDSCNVELLAGCGIEVDPS